VTQGIYLQNVALLKGTVPPTEQLKNHHSSVEAAQLTSTICGQNAWVSLIELKAP